MLRKKICIIFFSNPLCCVCVVLCVVWFKKKKLEVDRKLQLTREKLQKSKIECERENRRVDRIQQEIRVTQQQTTTHIALFFVLFARPLFFRGEKIKEK